MDKKRTPNIFVTSADADFERFIEQNLAWLQKMYCKLQGNWRGSMQISIENGVPKLVRWSETDKINLDKLK